MVVHHSKIRDQCAERTLKNFWALAAITLHGAGCKSLDAETSVRIVKNFLDVLKSMNLSLVAKNPAKEAAVPYAKILSLSPSSDETSKSEWVALVCISAWIVQHIRWKPSSSIVLHPAV